MIRDLPDAVKAIFPYEPKWAEVAGYRLHYVDEGPRNAEAIVLMHGNPTWAFVYRDFIPPLLEAGYRVVAPDYLGFGRSDHAVAEAEYAIEHHVGRTLATLDQAGVSRAVLFCHDWGGPIGLGMCVARPGLLAGAVCANTFWGVASEWHRRVFPWRTLHAPIAGPLLLGRKRLFVNGLKLSAPPEQTSGAQWDAYTLPFDAHHGPGGTLAFPRAISLGSGHPTQPLADKIWDAMATWDVPVRFVWGDADPVFPTDEQGAAMRERFPRGREHEIVRIAGARHFVQEYAQKECSESLIAVAKEALSGKREAQGGRAQ